MQPRASATFSFARPPIDFSGFAIGRDFLNSWMSGRAIFSGGPGAWFDFATYNAAVQAITGRPDLPPYYWSYPPHLVLFTWPLGLLPYIPAYLLWCIGGLGLYLFAARSCGVERRNMLFLALAPAVAVNVLGGQNGFITAALLTGGLATLDRRPILSGILFGILTIKPQFGMLVPVLLLVSARRRVVAAAILATAAMAGAIAIWFGPHIWIDYWREVMPQQHQLIIDAGRFGWPMVSSVFVGMRQLGLPADAAWTVQALSLSSGVGMVAWTFRRKRDLALSIALFVTATFLCSPWMLNYDMVVFAIVAALLGALGIPAAMMVLPALAGRLMWRLSHDEARDVSRGEGFGGAAAAGVPAIAAP